MMVKIGMVNMRKGAQLKTTGAALALALGLEAPSMMMDLQGAVTSSRFGHVPSFAN